MEDLQGLLEKINREGVEKAEAEAKKIVAAAEARAAEIVKQAEQSAAAKLATAEAGAKAFAGRSEASVRQAARDTVLSVRESVTQLFTGLLTQAVDRALGNEQTLAALVDEAIRGLASSGEIAVGEKLAAALKAHLAASGSFKVLADASLGGGFTVRLDGGRVEHDFTTEAVAGELARRLRPELAKLVK